MKLEEAAKRGITRLMLMKNGKPVWNPYSFGDITVFSDGTIGPWMKVYDPCGRLACREPAWDPINVLTLAVPSMASVEPSDEFEVYIPPLDIARFGTPPPIPMVRPVAFNAQIQHKVSDAMNTAMREAAQKRPPNYSDLSPEAQWEIDRKLGILDWDGK
jgi:hypothetical protein